MTGFISVKSKWIQTHRDGENYSIALAAQIYHNSRPKSRSKTRNWGGRKLYLLVDLDADGALGDVPDATGAAVVELVRHALVHRAVHLDVDVLADLVRAQVGGERDVTLLAEGAREQVARPRPKPVPRRHLALPSSAPTCGCAAAAGVCAALGLQREEVATYL